MKDTKTTKNVNALDMLITELSINPKCFNKSRNALDLLTLSVIEAQKKVLEDLEDLKDDLNKEEYLRLSTILNREVFNAYIKGLN